MDSADALTSTPVDPLITRIAAKDVAGVVWKYQPPNMIEVGGTGATPIPPLYNSTIAIDATGAAWEYDPPNLVPVGAVTPPTPTVTGLSPNTGPATGGTSVTITGTNLTGATAVKFGTVAATSFTVNSATSITATSPAGSGAINVKVTAPGGTSAAGSANQFTYVVVATATLDPAAKSDNITLSNGNLTATGFNDWGTVRATSSQSSGKHYSEFTIKNTGPYIVVGLVTPNFTNFNTLVGGDTNSIGLLCSGQIYANGGAAASGFPAFTNNNDVVQMAIDVDAKLIWWRVNTGNWNNDSSANPASGVGGYSFPAGIIGAVYPATSLHDTGDAITANFGATAYTYTPPTGFGNW